MVKYEKVQREKLVRRDGKGGRNWRVMYTLVSLRGFCLERERII